MSSGRGSIGRIETALAALGPGPLSEDAVRAHIAPLFSRVLAANRDRIYLANHSLGRPLDATEDDVREGFGRMVRANGRRVGRVERAEIAAFRARIAALLVRRAPIASCRRRAPGRGCAPS